MKYLSAEAYAALGFRCGVEIHQQLLTGTKMFCRCPAGRYTDEFDAEVLRHMRPTLSELGEYDGTALMEFKTKKEIIYRLNKESVCTYEMDDTPPFLVNQEALDIAIEIALLLNCDTVDELHIARKQYLDGSIPTGFQRTAIVGLEGWIPYQDRKIGIIQLGFEEDSCREVSDVGHTVTFRTDRLGMPLIEAVTYPDMKTPWEAAEVVERLGRIFRVTGKVRRGLGSVRQDVNVSITGGTRVELKGVSQIGFIPILTHVEALRQKALLEIRDELKRRGITEESLNTQARDVTDIFRGSKLERFRLAVERGHRIRGIKLSGLSGLLSHPVQPDINFDRELAGRVRVIACLDELPILYHTDNFSLHGGYRNDLKKLRKLFGAGDGDVIVLVWGPEADVITGTDEIRLRIIDAIRGVPSETRQAFSDGTSDFERILPGPDRMYPDTDLPPTRLDEERIARIQSRLPELPWKREAHYAALGVPAETGFRLAISNRVALWERLERELNIDLKLAAIALMQTLKSLERKGVPTRKLTDERLFQIFWHYQDGRFHRELLPALFEWAAECQELTISEILSARNVRILSEAEREQVVEEVLKTKPTPLSRTRREGRLERFYIGQAMNHMRGRVPAGETVKLIRERAAEKGLL